MRCRTTFTDAECGIEEEDSLFCPPGEIPIRGFIAEFSLDFGKNINKRRGRFNSRWNAETQPHSMSRGRVTILAQYDDFRIFHGKKRETSENLIIGW
jgi:hypothetical protein